MEGKRRKLGKEGKAHCLRDCNEEKRIKKERGLDSIIFKVTPSNQTGGGI